MGHKFTQVGERTLEGIFESTTHVERPIVVSQGYLRFPWLLIYHLRSGKDASQSVEFLRPNVIEEMASMVILMEKSTRGDSKNDDMGKRSLMSNACNRPFVGFSHMSLLCAVLGRKLVEEYFVT